MARSFRPCSTTPPRCVCPAPPPRPHPGSSRTRPTPPPPALGCCRTSPPPGPEGWKKKKRKEPVNNVYHSDPPELFFKAFYFSDQWRTVESTDLFKAIRDHRSSGTCSACFPKAPSFRWKFLFSRRNALN